mmetsp:Transcript_40814/g.94674  ORF Transcript_40814/g.94674 Transcript_40814/m.94674 type:complete len:109 (+) Transcript_40814:873-1199(+)
MKPASRQNLSNCRLSMQPSLRLEEHNFRNASCIPGTSSQSGKEASDVLLRKLRRRRGLGAINGDKLRFGGSALSVTFSVGRGHVNVGMTALRPRSLLLQRRAGFDAAR